jgi:hypothetical protein
MDPNATFSLFRDAVRNADWDAAVDHWCTLHEWLVAKGGFAPTWTENQRRNFFRWTCPE